MLDRNGLRPSRYVVTKDGFVVMASEVGVLDIPADNVLHKDRLQPGRMFLVDTAQGRIVGDDEIKEGMAAQRPYRTWLDLNLVRQMDLPPPEHVPPVTPRDDLLTRQQLFGYTLEDLRMLMAPMAINGQEAVGSMGTDTPLAALSDRPQLVFNYFKQLFAQVTNPPIDPIREDLVMSSVTTIGPEGNLFDETPQQCRQLRLETPILTNTELVQVKAIAVGPLRSATLPLRYRVTDGGEGLRAAVDELCTNASRAVAEGATILVLSDRQLGAHEAPIPSLLATAAVHHHLIREGTRTRCGIAVESGEPREVMHFALLLGYGAGAVNPYLAYETLAAMITDGVLRNVSVDEAIEHYVKAINKGLLKVASKMGISTVQSYRGAQIFEAIGLSHDLIDRYFTWTPSRIEGVGLDVIAQECADRHHSAYESLPPVDGELVVGGQYQWRRRGEHHMYNPETVAKLQHAVRSGNYKLFRTYSRLTDGQNEQRCTLRGLLKFRPATAIPIEEVEPASEIVTRFKTGAMSLGSISREAHETLAIAMNRIGGKSNTGEGGEDPVRFAPDANGDLRRSAIKQVASGRFGVTSNYLGEQRRVADQDGARREAGRGWPTPGAQGGRVHCQDPLFDPGGGFDLAATAPRYLLHRGPSAAYPRPQEREQPRANQCQAGGGDRRWHGRRRGLEGQGGRGPDQWPRWGHGSLAADLDQTRGGPVGAGPGRDAASTGAERPARRICVETDGQIKTGRDVVIATLLGAEEYGFASSALVASGCIMMRVCHLNTCPVGIATQDPVLRKKFEGKPEHVINFMTFIAEEVREYMAQLGFRTVDEMVGRVDCLDVSNAINHWKARGIDLSQILYKPSMPPEVATHCVQPQDHGLERALDNELIELAGDAITHRQPVQIALPIRTSIVRSARCCLPKCRVVGVSMACRRTRFGSISPAQLGRASAPSWRRGIACTSKATPTTISPRESQVGRIVVVPPREATFLPEENIIVGNVSLYGATGGEVFLRGMAGERFGVRNSGAVAVVEGVGDHGCEYMTKGCVVVLGRTGRNFAAGMSGGSGIRARREWRLRDPL